MSGTSIGPVLPPGFLGLGLPSLHEQDENENDLQQNQLTIGPTIEPTESLITEGPGTSEDASLYGPALPPGLGFSSGPSIIGPTLPPQFVRSNESDSEDTDDDVIGPLASEASAGLDSHFEPEEIERRSRNMKDKLLCMDPGEDVPKAREEWMTELPTNLGRKIGLGARTFSRREPTQATQDDRSAWTDTPSDKEKKLKGEVKERKKERDTKSLIEEARDREMAQQLEKYNKSKRKESLLDIHKKKRKKNGDGSKPKVRKEFDRDQDLGITRLDPLKTKRAIDGAKLLNGRFSHGSSQFL